MSDKIHIAREPLPDIPGVIPYIPTGKCPVLRKIPKDFPLLDAKDILGYQTVNVPAPEEHYLLLIQHRNVMNARIKPGDLLMIHAQDYAKDGQIIACLSANNECVLKRFQSGDTVLGIAVMSITLL